MVKLLLLFLVLASATAKAQFGYTYANCTIIYFSVDYSCNYQPTAALQVVFPNGTTILFDGCNASCKADAFCFGYGGQYGWAAVAAACPSSTTTTIPYILNALITTITFPTRRHYSAQK